MASTTIANDLRTQMNVRSVDFDPGVDTAAFVTLNPAASAAGLALGNFRKFMAVYFNSVGTGGITAFSIGGATAADGTGYVAAVSHAVGSNPNAVGDYLVIECTDEQIREVLSTATHVCVQVDIVTATDEGVVTFIQADPLYGPTAGLTADYVS